MLKKYVKRPISQIRKKQLSNKVVLQTLESVHCNHVSVKTCRNLCYMYMHKADSYKVLYLSRKVFPGIKDDNVRMQMVAQMAQMAEKFLICDEIDRYRKTIDKGKIRQAMERCKVNSVIDLMPMFVATFVVDGEHGLNVIQPIMKEAGVKNADVELIVQDIGIDQ
ncbi:MAG: hypothetical protein ACLTWO_05695 [Blautia massiliensis (ex Durand et al. 2017)]